MLEASRPALRSMSRGRKGDTTMLLWLVILWVVVIPAAVLGISWALVRRDETASARTRTWATHVTPPRAAPALVRA